MMSGFNYENDFTLLCQLKQGDPQAFNWLYNQHRRFLLLLAMSILHDMEEAQDLVQEFFADFWHLELYNKIDGEGRTNGFLKGYLNKALYRRALNRLRQIRHVQRKTADLPQHEPVLTPEEIRKELDWKEGFATQLASALQYVPPLSRRVFELAYLDEKSRNEIAEIMGISPHTVKNQLMRAMKILRERLKNYAFK